MDQSDFEKAINTRLGDEYSLDTIFYLRDGLITNTADLGPTWFDFGSRNVATKPSDETYVSFRFVGGVTRNGVLTTPDKAIKEENISLEFSIFRPKSHSRAASNSIENELDRLFYNWSLGGTGFQILKDRLNPKITIPITASGDDIESIKQIQYRFIFRNGW